MKDVLFLLSLGLIFASSLVSGPLSGVFLRLALATLAGVIVLGWWRDTKRSPKP